MLSPWRSSLSLLTRLIIIAAVVLALAGLQLLRPQDGMFVYYLLDRSDSIPAGFQEAARNYVHRNAQTKKQGDRAGVIVFGSEASIESSAAAVLDLQKVQAVVSAEKTDIAAAIRLAAAAFPEHGQKRITVLSDGNENSGDALEAVYAARELGVTLDVVPLGSGQGNDAILQRVTIPSNVKRGQAFEVKVFVQSERAQSGILRLFRNDQYLGEQRISLEEGKNQIAFTQTLEQSGFYSYQAQIEVVGDPVPQNNRGTAFVTIRGNPRVLLVSSQPDQDGTLFAALKSAQFDVTFGGLDRMPGSLPEWQSYDTIFLSNIAAGDLGTEQMQRLESAVRDYGVGLVCVGGDQAFAAGGYRGTPLESTLPIDMELSSKKVLPKGALVLVVHATEFPNGNQWARDIAYAALDALGPQDELGVVLWDGKERWLFELTPVGDKKATGKLISGMNPGDMVSFQGPMEMAADALAKSTANLKHMVVFSDGDPSAPRDALLKSIVDRRISISSVMIGGHVTPETMIQMAEVGKGRFYDVRSPGQLPQIFIKEAAVILKSAIMERPFKPRVAGSSEVIRGIDPAGYPVLYGTVASTAKSRAEVPLVTPEGDPLLAHWQYGLGRSVAFTSDARSKWAKDWVSWDKYRQFWIQTALWSVRRLQPSDVSASMNVEGGKGLITVEALDADGNYRNFLNLQTLLTAPDG
ncbi:MAG TPA: VWA domain-containing protein [Roseimicrobium sp.]|nr:VWA domain-containing protein [Roseimicrobium sp.]